MDLQPIPGLNPAVPADLATITAMYQALGVAIAGGNPTTIQNAAMAIGDDVITEYYYYTTEGNPATKTYLKTIGNNDLVKQKYWEEYLVRVSNNEKVPNWTTDLTDVIKDNYYRTSTNPLTGAVASGWLNNVLGRKLYVTTTFIQNGNVSSATNWVQIPPGCIENTITHLGYPTIQAAIDAASPNDVITVCAGTFIEAGQIVINKNLTIIGADKTTTIIKPSADQTNWFQVNTGITFNLSKVKLDGTGRVIENAINYLGNGVINNCWLTEIRGASKYDKGTSIQVENLASVDITNCTFDNIGRNGVRHRGTGTVSGNTYTGKGAGDWLDYFILAEYGGNVTISGNTVTNCTGVALLDGSGSCAIALWDDPNTTASVSGNILTDNAQGIVVVGINGSDFLYTWPHVTIGAGNIITGGEIGIAIEAYAPFTPQISFGASTVKGQTVAGMSMSNNSSLGSNYDISSIIYQTLAGVPIAGNFEKEDLTIHAIDAGNRGLFVWNNNKSYVTPISFAAPATTTPSIQRGIDVLATGGTVYIKSGTTYTDGASITALGLDLTLSPGLSPGCVALSGDMSLNSGDILDMELNGTTACTGYDQFTVDGTVSLGGASLNISLGYTPTEGDQFTIILNDGSAAVSGQFTQGTEFYVGSKYFIINYAGGDGNDVVLTCSTPTLYVNDGIYNVDDIYTTAIGSDANPGTKAAPFLTIQKAVTTAVEGTNIWVNACTFQEQVSVGKTVNISGVDRTKTIVKAPVSMTVVSTGNGPVYPIIYAYGPGKIINIEKLMIDGDGGRSPDKFEGIHYFEAGGTFNLNRITGIRNSSFNGNSDIAIVANHIYDISIAQTVNITNNLIDDYGKAGIVVNELNTQGIVTGNIVTGQNIPNVVGQNGIQFGYGSYGTITGNTVTNNIWNAVEHPHTWTAAGILLASVGITPANVPTGNTTTVTSNILSGNENALSMGIGGFGYTTNAGLIFGANTFSDNKIHVWLDDPATVPSSGNIYDKRVDNPAQTNIVYGCIQYAVDEASSGNILNASAGTFIENVVVHTPVTINGTGMANTTVIPAMSAPNPVGCSQSLCAGASNVFLIQANDVTIQNLTLKGDNPGLNSGVLSGGVDVDARNGIITDYLNYPTEVFNNLNINNVTIRDIYLRGVNNYKGTGFNFHHNNVINVAGEASSIAMFNSQGAGIFNANVLDQVNDGIASNHSQGTVYSYNIITNAKSGIHTDNNGSGGGTADVINNNDISLGKPSAYGIFVFAPYLNVAVQNNNVSGTYVGIASYGQQAAVTPAFTGNTVNACEYGIYTNTSLISWGSANSSHLVANNYITNSTAVAIGIASDPGYINNTTLNNNSITGNAYGIANWLNGTGSINAECNWWGAPNEAAVKTTIGDYGSPVDYTPWLTSGVDGVGTGFQPTGLCDGTPLELLSAVPDHVICGETEGSILVTYSGGIGPYDISWTGGSFDNNTGLTYTIPNLIPGTYSITVTDDYGITVTVSGIIIQSLPVSNTTDNPVTYYTTIQAAVNAGDPSDVIEVCNGTYIESNIFVNKSVTIDGQSRAGVIIVPAAEDANMDNAFGSSAQNGFIIAANGVTIQDVTIDGKGNPALTLGKNNFRTGIVTLDASQAGGSTWHNLHVNNVHVNNIYRRGISVYYDATTYASTGTLIEYSTVENIAFNDAIRIYGVGEVRNCSINNAFQGILLYQNTTTPATLSKINSNTITDIGNHPGCFGYTAIPSVSYTGQPRAIQFNNAASNGRPVEIKDNIISDNGYEAFSGAVGIYTRLANKNSLIDNNTINLTSGVSWSEPGSQNVGMLLGWSYDNGFMVTNNHVTSTKYGIGAMIFGNGTLANPLILEGNTVSSTNSLRLGEADGTGIYIANQYLFAGDQNPSYAIIRNDNNISGYVKGIEVVKAGTSTQPLTVIVQDNDASISGNTVGIDASYGSLTVSANDIHNNGTGIKLSGSVNLVSATNNFIRNNTVDGILIASDATGSIGTVNNNSITDNGGYGLNDLRTATALDANCNWWGSSSESGVIAEIGPTNSLVDYTPWLTSGSFSGGTGFQPTGTCNGTPVDITSAVADPITCGETTGSINVSWTGGVANYTVYWNRGSKTGEAGPSYNITGLAAGNYTITVTDIYGNSDIFGPIAVQYMPVTNLSNNTYYATIQAAVSAAGTGHTIQICNGLYKESNITVNKELTIQGQSKTGVVLAPAAVNNPVDGSFPTGYQYAFLVGSSDVTIKI
ncbi:MAG: hypothetical protein IPH57_06590 [Saprospiraceae bacterium]|nr:hypothetical protein [Saprospiraceae bacterium]